MPAEPDDPAEPNDPAGGCPPLLAGPSNWTGLSRRSFLVGSAGFALLSACGQGDGGERREGKVRLDRLREGQRELVANFEFRGGYLVSGIEQRMTFALVTSDGARAAEVPNELTFQVRDEADQPVGEPVTVAAHRDGVPYPYFPLRTTFPAPGLYQITALVDGGTRRQTVQVDAADQVSLRQPGQLMVPVDTPTPEDHRGVEPYCTREPACPLHDRTLTEVLTDDAPTALLVATPRFCTSTVCGPVLDLLLEQVGTRPGVRFVHAEVWADAAATGDLASAKLAPVVDAYGLVFEPALFLADRTGTIVERLDNVFDRAELRQALDRLGS
ncbi:MAG: hypothetical protein WHS89_11730 [Acidimicrobiales bacterium]